jgi:CRISPR-associated protein
LWDLKSKAIMDKNSIIKSPYNFVPLSEEVYTPTWADKISQDVPFKDGVSGKIQLRITAETPIFIRNGQKQDKEKDSNKDGQTAKQDADKKPQTFSKTPDGRFYIPATSIKGEVRNVLEIMSFGRMMVDERARFAHREWEQRELYPLQKVANQQEIHCGWLRKKSNQEGYEIEDCGKPRRIHHTDLDAYFGKKVMEENFSTDGNPLFNKSKSTKEEDNSQKTMAYKYGVIRETGLEDMLENFHYAPREAAETRGFANCVAYCEGSENVGTIVMTGQSASWDNNLDNNSAKIHEFVFPNVKKGTLPFSKEEFEHFKFIYSRDEKEWKFIRKRLDTKNGCPIFFRVNGTKVRDWGLAFMYKLPYDRSVYETLPPKHQKEEVEPDLAECIFGYINQKSPSGKDKNTHKNKLSLKGRVQFGHAFCLTAEEDEEKTITLSSPKASYYPTYIRQNEKDIETNGYKTYDKGQLSGWKRYVLKDNAAPESTGTEKTDTTIRPLKAGATFECDITFHNLRHIELGALLSALTFHNTPECRHQLGQGKPYGFGKVRYEVLTDTIGEQSISFYLEKFEMEMEDNFSNKTNWITSPQIAELFTIAQNHNINSADARFQYMKLDPASGVNDFINARTEKQCLSPLSTIIHQKAFPKTQVTDAFRQRYYADTMQELNNKIAELDSLPLETMEKQASMIKGKIETIRTRTKNKELISFVEACSVHVNDIVDAAKQRFAEEKKQLEVEKELAEAQNKANAQREAYANGLSVFVASCKSSGNLASKLEDWKKIAKQNAGNDNFTEDELATIEQALSAIYSVTTDKKTLSKWKIGKGDFFKRMVKVLGNKQITEELFKRITQ